MVSKGMKEIGLIQTRGVDPLEDRAREVRIKEPVAEDAVVGRGENNSINEYKMNKTNGVKRRFRERGWE